MPLNDPRRPNERPITDLVHELIHGFQNLIRGEFHLAKTEVMHTAKEAGRNTAFAAACGFFAAIGIFPLLAFLIIGLGNLLGDRFWLSSLIVSMICMGVGGFLTRHFILKMTSQDFTLPQARESIQSEAQIIRRNFGRVSEPITETLDERKIS